MFTARITRKVGEAITKDEMIDVSLSSLMTEIFMTYNDSEVLEIHITREEVKNENRNQG